MGALDSDRGSIGNIVRHDNLIHDADLIFALDYNDLKRIDKVGDAVDESGEAVYYNLRGMRIDRPTSTGVYIRVTPTGVEKVVIK